MSETTTSRPSRLEKLEACLECPVGRSLAGTHSDAPTVTSSSGVGVTFTPNATPGGDRISFRPSNGETGTLMEVVN